jgi:adenylosuccinate synthase
VGGGPFPSELNDDTGKWIQQKGHEYGATTGRPRRCGWLDGVVVKQAARLSGISGLCVTKLDVLTGLPKLHFGVGYRLPDGSTLQAMPASLARLAQCQPIYEEFQGWDQDISGARHWEDLPAACRAYLTRLRDFTGVPLTMVSVGPERQATIMLEQPF